ncbi:CoA transferase [Allobranchiibius sp. GilTou38]|uniref:CaiB/BaiF CoA transferase family protein n=1 Tax=Allobranchiibius sp. GilTou38 TaxID=2815210 RepID=UPI001AA15282|nr:CoA transferase [Allobranchiibius sp. GilTou38]MBO1768219.1 CoA transferase [Allobranchiibius sp. GilTou38]
MPEAVEFTRPNTPTDAHPGPLAGVRVIDLATVVMGPYACQILGDLGADVIKVESPHGDLARISVPSRHPQMGALALNVNRNKRSVVLDLKTDEGKADLHGLLEDTDVLVTNMRPGALTRLGFDYASLEERYPALIYCSAQGFRSDSPLADRAAYDEIVQAASGLTDLMLRATGTANYVPTILADKVCALTIVYSVLAAVISQQATGLGQHIEIPMTDTMLAFNLVEHLGGHTFEPPVGPTGFYRSLGTGHAAVETKDGWACILPYSETNVRDFFVASGHGDLNEDPRFVSWAKVREDMSVLYTELERIARERTTAEWETLCAEHSIPMAPVLQIEDATESEYVRDGHLLDVAEHPTEGGYRSIGIPIRFSRTPAAVTRPTPTLGQHNEEILGDRARRTEAEDA